MYIRKLHIQESLGYKYIKYKKERLTFYKNYKLTKIRILKAGKVKSKINKKYIWIILK